MAYSELVKSFERIRNYMREFYVYGFKSRDEYGMKSARSYDNERRRIESWLGDYMSFHQESSGKNVFLSLDSRRVPRNPLYKAFKAKSFTDKDITLHFYILDILADGSVLSSKEIVDRINDDYLSHFNGDFSLDESTVRKKLKEYEELGLLRAEKRGREVLYRRSDDSSIDLDTWEDALAFYSEADSLGVVGSFLMDKLEKPSDIFRFKHHYVLHALDSDILCDLLLAISERRAVELFICSLRNGRDYQRTVCPLKIYSSTQSGRQYLLGYHYRGRHLIFFRLDAFRDAGELGASAENDIRQGIAAYSFGYLKPSNVSRVTVEAYESLDALGNPGGTNGAGEDDEEGTAEADSSYPAWKVVVVITKDFITPLPRLILTNRKDFTYRYERVIAYYPRIEESEGA